MQEFGLLACMETHLFFKDVEGVKYSQYCGCSWWREAGIKWIISQTHTYAPCDCTRKCARYVCMRACAVSQERL